MADNMQTQAMERLKQMYSKAQPSSQHQSNSIHNSSETPKRREIEKTDTVKTEKQNEKQTEKKSYGILELFLKDKEKSLILLLIVLLISEKADSSVVLALLYLIL